MASRHRHSVGDMTLIHPQPSGSRDRDEVFLELTRSICPVCKRTVDAEVNARENQVFLRKRCPEHGEFEARVYGDAADVRRHPAVQQAGHPAVEYPDRGQGRLPVGLWPVPGAQAARLPGDHRGEHRLQPGLPDLLRRLRKPARQRARRLLDHPGPVRHHAGRVRRGRGRAGGGDALRWRAHHPPRHPRDGRPGPAAADRRGQPEHQRHPAGHRQAVRRRAGPPQPSRAPGQHLPAVRRPRRRDPPGDPRPRPARDQAAGAGQLCRGRPDRDPGGGHREGPQRARDRSDRPARAGPSRRTVDRVPAGHPLRAPRRVRPADPVDQLRRAARHRRPAPAVVHHQRLLPGAVLRPDLPVDHLPAHPGPPRRPGLRAGADPPAAPGRGLPRLRHQPGDPRPRGPRGAGEAVERLGVRGNRDQRRPAHQTLDRGGARRSTAPTRAGSTCPRRWRGSPTTRS